MPNVIENFFIPLRGSFLVPQGCDPAAFGRDLVEMLNGYTDHQLREAVRHFKETRPLRTFPTIAECRMACERYSPSPSTQQTSPRSDGRSDANSQRRREREAAAICRPLPIARDAQREGWLQTLLEFVEDHLREPSEYEARRLKDISAGVDANLHREPLPEMYDALCNFRNIMKARAAERIWGAPERAAPTGEIVTGRAALPPRRATRPGEPPEGMTAELVRQWHIEKLKSLAADAGHTLTDADIARLPKAPPRV